MEFTSGILICSLPCAIKPAEYLSINTTISATFWIYMRFKRLNRCLAEVSNAMCARICVGCGCVRVCMCMCILIFWQNSRVDVYSNVDAY